MNRILNIGLVFVVIGCGQGFDSAPAPTGEPTEALRTSEPPKPLMEPMQGCQADRFPQEAPVMPNPTIDVNRRKSAAAATESEARKLAAWEKSERENPTLGRQSLVPDPPPDAKLLERQARYLEALEQLQAKHDHRYGATYEKERVALKESIFPEE